MRKLKCVELEQGLEYKLDFGVKKRISSLKHVFKFTTLDTIFINFKLGAEDIEIIERYLKKPTEVFYAFARDYDTISELITIPNVTLIGLSLPCLMKIPIEPDSDLFDMSFSVPLEVKTLKEIKWTWSPDYEEKNLWPMLQQCGEHLTRLNYVGGTLNFRTIEVLARHCPNVTSLELFFDDVEDLVEVPTFKSLAKLRQLSLMSSPLIVELFPEILTYTPKLSVISIELTTVSHAKSIALVVNEYAKKFPRRGIKLHLSRTIWNKQSQDRKCPLTDKEKCRNLQIVCDY